ETPRSIAKADRGASRSVERREETAFGRINDPDWQEHGWPRWMSSFTRRKGGRPHLSRIPALRNGRSHKAARRSFADFEYTNSLCARHAGRALPFGSPRSCAYGNDNAQLSTRC